MKAKRNCFFLILVILSASSFTREASAATHTVGGSQGWDESTDFGSWASAQTFHVGDQLVFKYMPGLHSVVELGDESAYKSCDIGSSLNSLNAGNDVVKLDKPGTRYFACGTSGHCGQGMKVKITTVAGNAASNPSSSSNTATTSFSPSMHSHAVLPLSASFTLAAAVALVYMIDHL